MDSIVQNKVHTSCWTFNGSFDRIRTCGEQRIYLGYKGIPYSIDSCCHALYSVQLKSFDGVHAQSIKWYSKFEQFNLL